ncbi:MAG: hypothetical protein ACYDCH_10415 [Gaiellaceae bacterium]
MSEFPYRSPSESRPSETVAGFLSSFSIFASLIALAWHPLRLIPFAIVLSLVAAAMGGRHARLAQVAVAIAAICFFASMAITVITQRPLW